MSRSILAVSAVVLLVLAGTWTVAYAGASGADVSQVEPAGVAENATISVSTTATAAADPDAAVVRVAVVATAPDAETARQRVARNVSATRDALRDLGVGDDAVRTTYFDIGLVREPDGDATDRYRAAQGLEIEVDPDRAGAVVDATVGNGTNQVESVTFTVTEATRQRLRQQALQRAMADARSDATTLANESGVTVTGVQSVSTQDVSFHSVEARAGVAEADTPTTFEPGPVRVSAAVSVTYRAR